MLTGVAARARDEHETPVLPVTARCGAKAYLFLGLPTKSDGGRTWPLPLLDSAVIRFLEFVDGFHRRHL